MFQYVNERFYLSLYILCLFRETPGSNGKYFTAVFAEYAERAP
jgi:hypothetical protein